MQGKFSIEAFKKEVKSVYGGTVFQVTYDVEHTVGETTNTYEVLAEVRGINDFTPEICFTEVSGMPEHTNEETVTAEALLEELQSCTSGELCGDPL